MSLPKRQSEAFKQGITRYFTGRPCIHGHVSLRNTITGACAECVRLRNKRLRQRKRAEFQERREIA